MQTKEEIKAAAVIRHRNKKKTAVRQLYGLPVWMWAVRFLLTLLSVMLVHALWPMRLDASWGWAGNLRAFVGGMLGVLLWAVLDRVWQALKHAKPYH